MPKITRFPFFGKRFFRQARKLLGSCEFEHLWRLVMALAAMHGRRSLARIEELTDKERTRQAISHFLTKAEWDAPALLWQSALDTLRQLGFRSGDLLYVILDDTQKRKRGKQMAAVSKIFLHAEKVYANGHTILGAALSYRGVVIPCAVRLWASRSRCAEGLEAAPAVPLKFRKLTHLAADLVGELRNQLPDATQLLALFDSYYLCPAVTQACEQAGFGYLGVAKKNRNFAPDGRPHDRRKLGRYGKNVLAREGRTTAVQGKPHRLAQRVGHLSKAGRVKLVFSRRPGESAWVTLVTNQLRWSPKTIVCRSLFNAVGNRVSVQNVEAVPGTGRLPNAGVPRCSTLPASCDDRLSPTDPSGPHGRCQTLRQAPHAASTAQHQQLQTSLRGKLGNDLFTRLERGAKTHTTVRKIKELIQQ